MSKRPVLLVTAALVLLVIALGFGLMPRPVTAQTEAVAAFRTLLENARMGNLTITIQFTEPLIAGERSWTLPQNTPNRSISLVGADFICFSEPWNNGSRDRCTPFSNIVSVTYVR